MSHGFGLVGAVAVGVVIAYAVATVVAWILVGVVLLLWLFVRGIKRMAGS